ncbi:MAG: response regulator [Verrucomicrobia bacterium]|nr:response regulator [Verrucomicrobiota bacterium]
MDFALENASWPAFWVDQNRVIRGANQAAVLAFGATLIGGSTQLLTLWAPENAASLDQFWTGLDKAGGAVAPLKFRLKTGASAGFHACVNPATREGQPFFVFQLLRNGQPAARGGASAGSLDPAAPALDTTVVQKQKLDCAMQLIRTVALDFNNALTSILGHTSLLLGKVEAQHPWRGSLVEIEKSAEKAAEIANDLAAFSRQDKDARTLTTGNLNEIVRRAVGLFQTPAATAIEWTMQLENQLYSVNFDEAKMQQAFIKILDNAIQAVNKEGTIVVYTGNLDVDEVTRDMNITLQPGAYVCVEISDNGCGIEADVLPRIFEPFFTTKPNHRGLGLAWVYGIVTNHGGSVAVASLAGQGTSVRVYLPAQKKIVKDTGFKLDDLTGKETVLIVDDEDLLLTMGQTVLSSFGYHVLTANSGQKALEVYSKSPQAIDLVITDMVMPNMSGRELIERLRKQSPTVRIICASGYLRPAGSEEAASYLQKPFTSQELLRKVKQALA